MSELSDDLGARCRVIAEKAVQSYAQGILTAVAVSEQILLEWEAMRRGDDQPSHALLTRIAQRICSRELYNAWRSQESEMRNRAFDNLRRYLGRSLQHTSYASSLQRHEGVSEDILHQTLEQLQRMLMGDRHTGPNDPASFLKWTQTILLRQAYAALQNLEREDVISLEAHMEPLAERFVATDSDPVTYVLGQELQQTLVDAIVTMRNHNYRVVLIYTYLVGMDERELAGLLGVELQEIYLWRHRALKALRSKPHIAKVLRSFLE